jgi:hypothetical protein
MQWDFVFVEIRNDAFFFWLALQTIVGLYFAAL